MSKQPNPRCVQCKYDLSGLAPGCLCPECGTRSYPPLPEGAVRCLKCGQFFPDPLPPFMDTCSHCKAHLTWAQAVQISQRVAKQASPQ